MLSGIDISRWQGDIEFSKIPLHIRFAIAKASQGNRTDPKFARNWAGLRARSIIRGAYHLLNLEADIQTQVNHYLSLVPFERGDLPPVLDIETHAIESLGNPELAHERIIEWLSTVAARVGGQPILYVSPRGVRKLAGHTEGLSAYPLWDVDYQTDFPDSDDQPELPETFDTWVLWQWTSSGPGLEFGMESVRLDLDVFNGDEGQLQELAHSIAWGAQNMLTPEQVNRAASFNAGRGFTLRQVFRIFDATRVTNPWDITHVCNQIANYQGLMGLTADGMVGEKTSAAISGMI